MAVLLTGRVDGYAQLVTVLVVFVLVLAVTALVTRWIANYQKQQNANCNIEVMETTRISSNKYIQIIRAGEKYMVIAVCKDTVTLLGEIPGGQLKDKGSMASNTGFSELFGKMLKKSAEDAGEPKE